MMRQRLSINSGQDHRDDAAEIEAEDRPLVIRMRGKDGAISCSEMILDMQPVMHGPCTKRSGASWLIILQNIFNVCLGLLPKYETFIRCDRFITGDLFFEVTSNRISW